MAHCDKIYNSLVQEVLDNGQFRDDRTGTGTLSCFGLHRTYNLKRGFPLITTKKVAWKTAFSEMLWFLHGCPQELDMDNESAKNYKLAWKLWEPWEDKKLIFNSWGPIYGKQWFKIDENNSTALQDLQDGLETDPFSRRHLLNCWNYEELPQMALPPCHFAVQFYVRKPKKDKSRLYLDCQLYQRSADICLGVPFNLAGYALFTHLLANRVNPGKRLVPGKLHHSIGDAHIYVNHLPGIREQLSRPPLPPCKLAPLPPFKPIEDINLDDLKITGYTSHPKMNYEVSV